ncbi:TMV resistance protein N-like [Prunus avium]|uniref:TMV resistance protein N-like n=1 Tax=Prunus avium TaxID=42229 RepID=A0A6P5REI4_PRUAV|nr:TMV resistance protein N-like [Prunus avium]
MVGIWGTSGIGKTTIAKAIWNEIAHKFEGSCFLPNVREGSLVQLQETLLDKLLGKNLKIGNVDEGIGVITERLRHKKILLILDDVDQLEQLENLAGDGWFGEGSRVIITTKDRGLLDNREIELIYKVKKLYYNQALELLSWHAFGRSEPPEDYLELAQRAIAFADGLPLALAILGSHLRNRGIRRWQVILDDYKGEPYTHIERILQKSYDALDHRAKEYFLDIACFFKGEYEDYVLRIVPKIFIEEFVDKALITIEGRMILMHDLLANLGKDIVHKESPNDPGQRSRLWFYKDVKLVLTENTGTRNIKGIMVKLPKAAKITLNPECFRNMVNLKIFINHNASLCGDINYLPNVLRWIDWDGYQLQSLPPNFQGNHLVKFKMSRSHIRQLEGFKVCIQKILRKSYDALENSVQQVFLDIACFFKGEAKDYVLQIVSNSKNKVSRDCIEVLIEKAMITIDYGGIQMHDLLEKLGKDIVHEESPNDPGKRSRLWFYEDVEQVLTESTGTRNIKGIMVKLPYPTEITLNPECFRDMVNLEIFINRNASLCGHINNLPNALRFINWDRCQLQSLPPNFQGNHLVEFNMPRSHIRQLEGFNFKHSPNLTIMNLKGCQFLEKIPDLSGIPNIKYLNLSMCTRLVEVDGSVGFLDKLVELDLSGCVKLMRFGTTLRLKSLEELDLSDCGRLESFPKIEVKMESLRSLDISGSGVRELPSPIGYLTGLETLHADYCEDLTVTVNSELLPNLYQFSLMGCNLSKINFLLLLDCWSTVTELYLSGNNFVNLPISFSKFVNLLNLYLNDCKSLLEIPEQVLPRRIESVLLDNCTSLEKIPKLAGVFLDNCTPLEKIPEISSVNHKFNLSLANCVRLRGYDITENIFLNQASVSSPHSHFHINLPGDAVPKWFSCCKDTPYSSRCEVSFEIPPNLKGETLRLVLCVVTRGTAKILLNGKLVNEIGIGSYDKFDRIGFLESHMCLASIPLLDWRKAYVLKEPLTKQGNTCQVIFNFSGNMPTLVKIPYGVHLLGHQVVDHGPMQLLLPDVMAVDDDIYDDQHQDCELLSLSLASKTNLGKRPRQSDYMALHDDHRANVVDIGDHEAQWLTLFTGPADHQKRRHIDLNEEPKYVNSLNFE